MTVYLVRFIARLFLQDEWLHVYREVMHLNALFTEHPNLLAPLVAQRLLISGEDHRHARHRGFDTRAICRAIWRRIATGRREGASTIEQQIVRVLTNRFEPTLRRKLRELLLATLLSEVLPKFAMPGLYLSIGYFGWRMNGFTQACRRLGLHPSTISLDEAAALVARLKYPEPRLAGNRRLTQIDRRREHLKKLYRRHLTDRTYKYLRINDTNEAITHRTPFAEVVQPTS